MLGRQPAWLHPEQQAFRSCAGAGEEKGGCFHQDWRKQQVSEAVRHRARHQIKSSMHGWAGRDGARYKYACKSVSKERPCGDEHVENQAGQLTCLYAPIFLAIAMLSIKPHCLLEPVGAVLTYFVATQSHPQEHTAKLNR